MQQLTGSRRSRFRWRDILVNIAIVLCTLAVFEIFLRVVDLRELRDAYNAGANLFQYDAEIGWRPIPDSAGKFVGSREIDVRHNNLGLRDIAHDASPRPTVLFVGDSFTWGYDAQANERFTDLLRNDLPGHRIVNAGVPGFGTDQEYLLLRRIWPAINPAVVVLIFCVENDRVNNSMNIQYAGYFKPYLQRDADGAWRFSGQPVPWSRSVYFREHWWVRNLWLARMAVTAYVYFFHHFEITVADPTDPLIDMMRDFVEARGARLLVGLQRSEPQLEAFLQAKGIPFVAFDGAESYPLDGSHWTPAGHRLVADRLLSLLSASGVAGPARAASPAAGRAD